MIEAAETACGFVSGKALGDLDADRMLVFALVRAIEIVGEAGSKVSADAASRFRHSLVIDRLDAQSVGPRLF
jgi:uncharacterized protein with HEPN domain